MSSSYFFLISSSVTFFFASSRNGAKSTRFANSSENWKQARGEADHAHLVHPVGGELGLQHRRGRHELEPQRDGEQRHVVDDQKDSLEPARPFDEPDG